MKQVVFTLLLSLIIFSSVQAQQKRERKPIGDTFLELEFKVKEFMANFKEKVHQTDVIPNETELKAFADRSLIIINGDTLVEKSLSDFWSDVETSEEYQEGMDEIRQIPPPSTWFPKGILNIDKRDLEIMKQDMDKWIDENILNEKTNTDTDTKKEGTSLEKTKEKKTYKM